MLFVSLLLMSITWYVDAVIRCASGLSTGIWTQRRSTLSWGWCMKHWLTARKGDYTKFIFFGMHKQKWDKTVLNIYKRREIIIYDHFIHIHRSGLKILCSPSNKWSPYKSFQQCLDSFHSEAAAKVMVELLGSYTEDNASQARVDAHR